MEHAINYSKKKTHTRTHTRAHTKYFVIWTKKFNWNNFVQEGILFVDSKDILGEKFVSPKDG